MLRGLPDLAKENRDKSKITKHLIVIIYLIYICFCQRETMFKFFTYLINSKLISELIGFLVFLCNTIMTNFDKHNNFNLNMRNNKNQ